MSNITTRGDSHFTKHNSNRRNMARWLATAVIATGASSSLAASYNFTGATNGNWNASGNWTLAGGSTHVVPVNGDSAFLGVTGTTALAVNFNQSYTGSGLTLLELDAQVPSTITLNQTAAGTAMIATNEIIGNSIYGNIYNQTAGTNTVNSTLTLGSQNSSFSNTYDLNSSSGTGTLKAATEDVGNAGTGLISQNAGTNTVTGTLSLGTLSTGNGQYTLNSVTTGTGTLSAADENIGDVGTGALTQNAGSNTVSDGLYVGNSGSGTYTMNSGNLTVLTSALEETMGYNAGSNGVFTQNGGMHTLGTSVEMNVGLYGTGTYNLNGGTLTSNSLEVVAYLNTGTFNQLNGANVINSGSLFISAASGVVGNYNLQGGAITATSSYEAVGVYGNGTLTQSGTSTNSINTAGNLYVGANTGATGNYNLQGGTLTVAVGSEYIGGNTGAVASIGTASSGATGTFTQSGGSNNINNVASALYIGINSGDTGTYLLQGGSLTSSGGEYVGTGGAGTFTQSGTSINTIGSGSYLQVGLDLTTGGSGSNYNLQGGQLIVSGGEIIGNGSAGTFTQSGGTNTITGQLTLGNESDATYTLSSGTLTTNGEEFIGEYLTTTTFTQSGGTNNANGGIDIAEDASGLATASYTLGTGAILNAAGEEVGDDGVGTFVQNGGSNNITGYLNIATASGGISGSHDSYTMNGGTLTASDGESVGTGTFGVFVQNGGTNTANGSGLSIGGTYYTSSYTLDNTVGILNATGIELNYNGTLNVSAGSVNAPTGTLTADSGFPGVSLLPGGQINFSGGSMTFAALNFNGTPSAFNWTGGTLNLTQGITFDPGALPTSTAAAFGGELTLNSGMSLAVTGNETIGGGGFFTLVLNAGSVDTATGLLGVAATGSLIQNGGPIAQNVTNQGTFTYLGGAFTGQLINQGLANFAASGVITNGLSNTGNVTGFGLGVTMIFNGAGLTNIGSITLAGGAISGAVINTGLISGYGSIFSTAITNSGTITQSGGNLTLSSTTTGLSNTGTINLTSGLLLSITGPNATNDGTINLNGGTLGASTSLTNNTDGVVAGPGRLNSVFINNGTLEVPNGTTSTGSFTNNGVIEMAGTAAVLGSGTTITNASTIEGFGKISDVVTNNQTVQPIGGTLTFTNPLTNSTSGTISIPAGGKILMQGATTFPTNAGLISLTGGTFDNGGNPLNNTGSIIGYGTFATGGTGLTNNGNITFEGGTSTTVNGNVTNATGKTINIKYQSAIFTGNLTNNTGATINTFSTSFTVSGIYTNNGTYNPDPTSSIFQSNVISGGSMTGSTGDEYIFSGGTFNNSGTFTNSGLLQSSDATTNSGTFTQSGPQNWTAGTTFTNTAGTATFNTDSGSASSSPLTMAATGGVIKLNVTQHLAALSITGSGKVDMTDTVLFIATTPAATIRTYLASSYDHGNWDLPGLTSSAISTHAGTSLGYNVVSSGVEVKYTWMGDANLDGVTNSADLAAMSAGGTTWATGDFNYDGVVNADDYGLFMLGSLYGATTNIASTLPEPGVTPGLIVLCGSSLGRRRLRGARTQG